jgi:hypothetical protein
MPSVPVAATLRQYPSHPAATLKHTAHGSPFRPILNTEHIPHCRPSLPTHQRALVFPHHDSEAMLHTTMPAQIRRHCVTVLSQRHVSSQIPISSDNTPRHALPRKIAAGVFFVDPTSEPLPSPRTLFDLEITHAVVARGSSSSSDLGTTKALFVGPHDPLSKIVAWMRAVRRLGACIVVSDIAAAAGFLVVELGLSPRSAWLRIARGLPPPGDLVLARLCALALTHGEKVSSSDKGPASPWGVASRSCRSLRGGTRGESSLKHVLVSSL